jgi:hypothetical protein
MAGERNRRDEFDELARESYHHGVPAALNLPAYTAFREGPVE